jgi:monoamine oxidase
VEVESGDGALAARAAVVTVPPAVVRRLLFEPALPAERIDAARALDTGDAIVLCVASREPAPWSAWALVVGEIGDAPRAWAAPLASTLFFAGEATALGGERGLVDGAIESGRRAAREVLAAPPR